MPTVVAIETDDGVVIAGDSRAVVDGTVQSDQIQRVVDLGAVGVGVVGAVGDLQTFHRRFEAAVRSQEIERDVEADIDRVARIAAREAERASVDAAVAARDADGIPRLRQVGADGRVLAERVIALGSGAAAAAGRLEARPNDLDFAAAVDLARDVVETVRERDVETGGAVDVWTLGADVADGAEEGASE